MFADAHKPLGANGLDARPDGICTDARPLGAGISYDVYPTPAMLADYDSADKRGANGV